MTIDRILLGCNKKDWHMAKICLASIRYWCPEIPIALIVDELSGTINTLDLERQYNITRYAAPIQKMGWGINTLLPMTAPAGKRSLFVDADIVFLGDVVGYLEQYDEEVLVSIDKPKNLIALMELTYFTQEKIRQFDAEFKLPTYLFNCGQLVFNEGILSKADFIGMVDWNTSPPSLVAKDTFICADQSMLNYHITRLQNQKKITVKPLDFSIWGFSKEAMSNVSLGDIKAKHGIPKMIHWAGIKPHRLSQMPRSDLLSFYENIHYQGVAFGKIRKQISHLHLFLLGVVLKLKKRAVALKKRIS
jgi:hypothetical protein